MTAEPTASFAREPGTMPSQSLQNDGQPKQRVICVFCGSKPGNGPDHLEAARDLAKAFHENNINLVYGGGTFGIMGEVAQTLVSLSGPDAVHGIIPAALIKHEQGWDPANPDASDKVIVKTKFGRTTVVKDMHSRKQMMAQEVISGGPGSGFVALSGGYGTMEELMEVTTWNQLGIHNRGVVLFNVGGYWDCLLQWVKTATESGFIDPASSGILVEAKTASEVLRCLQEYKISVGRYNLEWESEG